MKELEKGFGNIRQNSREQTGSNIAGKWKSDEEEQETAVGVLTFSSRLANKMKFSTVLEEPEEAKSQRTGSVHCRTCIVGKYLRENKQTKQKKANKQKGNNRIEEGERKNQNKTNRDKTDSITQKYIGYFIFALKNSLK